MISVYLLSMLLAVFFGFFIGYLWWRVLVRD